MKVAADMDARYVFIEPPSMEELERRLRGRATDPEEAIRRRLKNATAEIQTAHTLPFHAFVVNDTVKQAYADLRGIVAPQVLECRRLRELKVHLARGGGVRTATFRDRT